MEQLSKSERIADAKRRTKELADWFEGRELPTGPIKLNEWTTIEDCKKFVRVHLCRLQPIDIQSKVMRASFEQLKELKSYLENGR